jgi:hypothetical protein
LRHDPSGLFSVKSAYLVLRQSSFDELFISEEKLHLLSKVAVFSWQLLQDRLPTRHNLWKRGVITDVDATRCVLCGLESESVDHLLFHVTKYHLSGMPFFGGWVLSGCPLVVI